MICCLSGSEDGSLSYELPGVTISGTETRQTRDRLAIICLPISIVPIHHRPLSIAAMSASSFALWSVPVSLGLTYLPHAAKVAILSRTGAFSNTAPRDTAGQDKKVDPSKRALVDRLRGAHLNQLETIGVYAAGVAAATAVGVPAVTVSRAAKLYVGARVVFNISYAGPQIADGNIRSLSFTAALGAIVWMWAAAARHVAGA